MQTCKRLAVSLVTSQMLLACTTAVSSGGADALNDSSWTLSTLAYRCGDQRILLTQRGDSVQLDGGGHRLALRPVAAASGAKYVAVNDDRSTFWSKGERATLVVAGQAYPECRLITPAGRFRAVGNEPPWSLEISDGRLLFTTDYGQRRIELPTAATEKTSSFARHTARGAGHEVTATIFDRPCIDSMSGMPHPNTVSVVADGQTVSGCGGDPATLLQGGEWVVEDLYRAGIVDDSRATLNFAADGRLAGRSFCNSYSGDYWLSGETLTLSIVATTRKTCPPALMQQERLFMEVVKAVRRFSLNADGALVLEADNSGRILARPG